MMKEAISYVNDVITLVNEINQEKDQTSAITDTQAIDHNKDDSLPDIDLTFSTKVEPTGWATFYVKYHRALFHLFLLLFPIRARGYYQQIQSGEYQTACGGEKNRRFDVS
jgi:hypothetical protein